MVARTADSEEQQIPSWTGFNTMTRGDEPVSQDVISYLLTINAPTTELTTVNEHFTSQKRSERD